MKKFIPYITLFFLSFSTLAFTQNTDPIRFVYEVESPQCYLKTDYPSSYQVIRRFIRLHLGYDICGNNNCPLPNHASCTLRLLNTEDIQDLPTQWCFEGVYKLEWKCPQVPPGEGEGEGGEGGEGSGEEDREKEKKEDRENRRSSLNGQNLVHIQKVYPNPSSGNINMDLAIDQVSGNITIVVADWLGRVIQNKTYETGTSSTLLHTQTDISNAANGIYFLSVKVDGVVMETRKILLQK